MYFESDSRPTFIRAMKRLFVTIFVGEINPDEAFINRAAKSELRRASNLGLRDYNGRRRCG